MRKLTVAALFTATIATTACQNAGTASAVAKDAAQGNAGSSSTAAPSLAGTVSEVLDGGQYTYLKLESNGTARWAAIPKTTVKVGQQVELRNGMEMKKFESKALNRTFDSLVFSDGLKGETSAAAAMAAGHGKSFAADTGLTEAVSGKVVETMNSGGYTYCSVETAAGTKWVAVPEAKVEKGQTVSFLPGNVLKDFNSRLLNRTFDTIVFSNGLADAAAATTASAPAAAPHDAAGKEEFALVGVSGKVVETTDVGGFSYVAVEKDGKKLWVAVPTTKLTVGQEVKFLPGEIKRNLPSKKMKRTFEEIQFSRGLAQ
ncbi:hypothetical protein LPW11_02345 [Geomonas sp. RF6]|uniref:hypothetical protein n=1 Tax=Geomonas sp. RF6 TaxID=2897342 RepID=UPI001E5BEAAC|nr:hypothetical protein [Geomonas sp. RF6]UFS71038.1 hypothetical protein LPW11_02345 [Geomonas sp. RF6]